jgi:hypothetical protein
MKIIIKIIGLLLISQLVNAQCWQTKNTQTTDWRNYPPNGNLSSTNSWDWTRPGLVHDWYASNTQVAPNFI